MLFRYLSLLLASGAALTIPAIAVGCSPCAKLVVDSVPGAAGGNPFIIGRGQFRIDGALREGLFFNSAEKLWFYDGYQALQIATGHGRSPVPDSGIYWTTEAADVFYAAGTSSTILLASQSSAHDVLPDDRLIVRTLAEYRVVGGAGPATSLTGLRQDGEEYAIHAGGWIYSVSTSSIKRIRPDGSALTTIIMPGVPSDPYGGFALKSFVAGERLYLRSAREGLVRIGPDTAIAQPITTPAGALLDVMDTFNHAVVQSGIAGFAFEMGVAGTSGYWKFDNPAPVATLLQRPLEGCNRFLGHAGIEFERNEVVFECMNEELSWTDGNAVRVNFASGSIRSSLGYRENRPRGARLGADLYAIISWSGVGERLTALRPVESGIRILGDLGVSQPSNGSLRVFSLNQRLVFAASTPATGLELFTVDPDSFHQDGFE